MEEGLDNNILDFDNDGRDDVNQIQSEFEIDSGNDNQRSSEFEVDCGNDQVFMEDPNVVNEECIIVGKTFCSPDEAYTSYNNYALKVGFGIRKQHFTRSKVTNLITRYRYVCNKAGRSRDPIPSMTVQGQHLRVSRINCKALMEISSKPDGSWAITRFEDIHCHEFTSPLKTRKHRSHKIIHRSKACKSLIQELSQSGLRPVQIKKVVSVISGVEEDIITSKQVSNMLGIERISHLGRECYGIINYFKRKAEVDDTHFFAMDLHLDGSLRNVFWADGRSRESYYKFRDVLVFDVTYRTNKFKMPFAPFVGVNHHYQSILFGGALLEDEKEDTFVWLFTQFLRCMFNKHPISIITDQDSAICNAVKRVFPHTCHRFCVWHIQKHMVEHLQSENLRYPTFNSDLREVVKSRTIAEFEERWKKLYEKYELSECGKNWLGRMYNLRHHWVKSFLNDIFFARMTTSGRCESMHNFFDGFVNSNTMLDCFVIQYDSVISTRRRAEEDEDFKSLNTMPSTDNMHAFVVKAGALFTPTIYVKFMKEWNQAVNTYTHETLEKNDLTTTYRVGISIVPTQNWHRVNIKVGEPNSAKCSCARMETFDIPCKHILYILKKKKVIELPDSFILKRWTTSVRHHSSHVEKCTTKDLSFHYLTISAKWLNVLGRAKEHDDVLADINNFFDDVILRLDEKDTLKSLTISQPEDASVLSSSNNAHVNITIRNNDNITVRDLEKPFKTKGRPRIATRFKSGIEVSKKVAKPRSCSICGKKGHYRTKCPIIL